MAYFACNVLGWGWDDAFFKHPASIILLMQRQEMYMADVEMMHLSEIEDIDNFGKSENGK